MKQLLITGAGGQGKTALTGQLAKKLQAQGYLVLAYSARPEDSDWTTFIAKLHEQLDKNLDDDTRSAINTCNSEQEQAELYLQALLNQSQQKLVLFFDNLESVQSEDGVLQDENLQVWINVTQRLNKPILLLTSRWCLPEWKSPQHHVLARPSYGDFLRYLKELDKAQSRKPPFRSKQLIHELYQKLGGNFKGLEFYHATEWDGGIQPEALLQRLDEATEELQAFTAIEFVVNHLTEQERMLLEHLPVYKTFVAIKGIKQIAQGLPEPEKLLQRLISLSLVEIELPVDTNEIEYQISPIVFEWLNNRDSLPVTLQEKAAEYQLWVFDNSRKTLTQAIISHEAFVFAQLQEKANQFALDKIVGQLIHVGMYQRVLTDWLPPLRESDKQEIKAKALGYSGLALDNLGNYDKALDYYEQSLLIQQEIGDRSGEGRTLNNISQIYSARGEYETALGYLKQSLKIFREAGNRSEEGTTLNNISQIYDARGEYETALGYLKQSLLITQEIGDMSGMCATLFNIGHIHWTNEEQQEAITAWAQVYLIANKIGEAQALNALDNLAKQLGGTGLETWEQLARQ
ncbi:tetratricopeptide repeat protein [Candidatus Albibeggiatoa sp. nov. BB20]|uniref:tetratricopeptide repeat protein n=1 Tax=Candidatus Albibeggiatoa sp. nov. BB20 TaxID=3162723 RepID=UPI003365AA29